MYRHLARPYWKVGHDMLLVVTMIMVTWKSTIIYLELTLLYSAIIVSNAIKTRRECLRIQGNICGNENKIERMFTLLVDIT